MTFPRGRHDKGFVVGIFGRFQVKRKRLVNYTRLERFHCMSKLGDSVNRHSPRY